MMRTTLRNLFTLAPMVGVAMLLSSATAQAAPVGNTVLTTVEMNNDAGTATTELAAGLSPLSTSFGVPGTDIGNSLGASPVVTDYTVSPPLVGPNGGTRYDIGIRIGSQTPGGPPFNDPTYYTEAIIPQGSALDGPETINQILVSFGVGGGGVAFDEVSSPAQISLIDAGTSIRLSGEGLPPNFSVSSVAAGNPITPLFNADGTIGFQVLFDADDFTSSAFVDFFAGDWATRNVNGFGTTIRIELVPEPASLAIGSVAAVGGLIFVRRRRK